MQAISRFADGLCLMLGWIVGIFLAAATAAVFLQVVIRFVLPLFNVIVAAPWTEEAARYLMVWVVFLGVAVLCRSYRLISVEMLAIVVPKPAGTAIKLISTAISIGFFALVAQIGFGWTMMSGIELSPVMRLPMNWVYFAVPIGSLLAIFNLLVFAGECLVGSREAVAAHAEIAD
ncbi:C4-dicarboxylate transporter DctQ subunit [Mesorhizobium sp. J18]|uniref:TRAP transporter small permease n=1 Tax=Mesorhizobium sp. J18 TaxID=935263 RepID=UPI0011996C84|nr:TRAP transporter small permease subunit [Mesorhizobium sp. J18]TWG94810.1 C4-dicarboxylate transporter DctQ subunit [Mesorhizobium sp. J18]